MATPLDLSLIGMLGDLFPFLFVWVMAFAILSKVKVFGDRKGLDALISLLLALLVLISPLVKDTIERMAPWFVLFFIFGVFVVISFMIFGFSEANIADAIRKNTAAIYWIIAIGVIFFLGSLLTEITARGGVGGAGGGATVNADGSVASGDQQSAFWATITHPKVLGLALIMLIATFTVSRMTAM